MGLITRLLTKKRTQIPLFYVTFNHKQYKKEEKENSCMVKAHPIIGNDKHIKKELGNLIDYIRDNYDMDKM